MLSVEPKNEDYKMISAMFNWSFFLDKNILFVFGKHNFQDFALVFDKESRGKIVYDFICKENTQNAVIGKDMLVQRFMVPFCNLISKGGLSLPSSKLVKIIREWTEAHENDDKETYIKFLKDNNVFDILCSNNAVADNISISAKDNEADVAIRGKERSQNNNRKRRHSKISKPRLQNNNTNPIQIPKKKKELKDYSKIVKKPVFEFFNIQRVTQIYRRLLIFTSSERSHCYEYSFIEKSNLYYCTGCQSNEKRTTAIMDKDENGLECIKMEDNTEHCCSSIKFIPENYIPMKVIKKPRYEILENCNAVNGKLLIIFNENDATQCWEFKAVYAKNMFICRQCGSAAAKLWYANTDDEYIELRDVNHCCKYVPVNREKYYQFKQFILSPDFEIQKIYWSGEEKKRLIIFNSYDRSLCYSYTCDNNIFYCHGCKQKRYKVPAKLLQNSDGDDYVLLSKRKHICELRKYSKWLTKDIIIRAPNFVLLESTENDINKLFIFDSKNQSLCYTFSQKCDSDKYLCLGCQNVCYNQKKQHGKVVSAQLCKDKIDGEIFVRLNSFSTHLCKPQKYEPEKFEKKEKNGQKCYDFFFFRRKTAINGINVALSHPGDKRLCFEYTFQTSNSFRCNKCGKKRNSCYAKMEKDEDGKEYFYHDYRNHICKPIKAASIRAPDFIMLKREDLKQLDKKKTNNEEEIDENRIIKAPNFELGTNDKGIPSLFVFTPQDRSHGYKYLYLNRNKKFICSSKTSTGCYNSAKLHLDDNGEKQIILGMTEHKCQPVKYTTKDVVVKHDGREIKTSDFITLSKEGENVISNVIIFTTPEQNLCYDYCKSARRNIFLCLGCKKANKIITAELCKNENGKDILKLSKHGHVCTPRKYVKEKYNKRIITSDSFVFHDGRNGKKDKYLIVFISEKKDFAYQYYATKGRSYSCSGRCIHSACVIENDTTKSVRLCGKEHACEPIKYDPEKYVSTYEEPKIITNELFQFVPNTKGDANKTLLIFASNKKDLVYEYHFSKNIFKCTGCTRKNNYYLTVKILQNDGITSIQLSQKEHVCEPKKYNPNKYIFLQPKYISKELFKIHDGKDGKKFKYLFVFASADNKKLGYQYNLRWRGYYYCRGCEKVKLLISAKIIQSNDDGNVEGIELCGKEHICKPQKYNPKKYRN